MYYAYKYRLEPSDAHREELDRHRDICRQLYNHALYRFNQIPDDAGTVKQRVRSIRDELPNLKQWWDGLTGVYSTVLQTAVMRIADNIKRLGILKRNGRRVGQLKWKSPRDYRSFTYSQSGFELKNTSGRTLLSLSKLGDIPIRLHREIPDDAKLKQVTLKKEPTGEWFAAFGVETPDDPPEKPENPKRCVGIDVGILSYTHDTSGTSVDSTSQTNANAWNANNGSSLESNTVRRTTRNNVVGWQSATRISRTSVVTSCTSSRTTTLGSTTLSRLKT